MKYITKSNDSYRVSGLNVLITDVREMSRDVIRIVYQYTYFHYIIVLLYNISVALNIPESAQK
jgi:hypothetical protein